jgi:hypothetical protein
MIIGQTNGKYLFGNCNKRQIVKESREWFLNSKECEKLFFCCGYDFEMIKREVKRKFILLDKFKDGLYKNKRYPKKDKFKEQNKDLFNYKSKFRKDKDNKNNKDLFNYKSKFRKTNQYLNTKQGLKDKYKNKQYIDLFNYEKIYIKMKKNKFIIKLKDYKNRDWIDNILYNKKYFRRF